MLTAVLAFLGACTLIAASPGPSSVLIIRQSLRSRRAGMLTVLGNETGVFIWGVVAACGLSALLAASEVAYGVMRIVGAVVLIWFGIQTLRAARKGADDGTDGDGQGFGAEQPTAAGAASGRRSYRAGLVMSLANPKAGVFAVSFLPQFVPSGAPELPAMVGLAAVWAVYEVGYYALYVWFVGRMKALLNRATVRRRLEQISGGVLLALGLRLAVEG